jgi:transposase-like protein
MPRKRKLYSDAFKATVALAAVKGDRTMAELASHFDVHATLVQAWKKQLVANAETVFAGGAKLPDPAADAKQAELYEQLGRVQMELAWLKKKVARYD